MSESETEADDGVPVCCLDCGRRVLLVDGLLRERSGERHTCQDSRAPRPDEEEER